MEHTLFLLFFCIFFVNSQIVVDFNEIDQKGVCGNGQRHRFEEDCDSVEHCTEDCRCETNYYAPEVDENCVENCTNACLPVCEIEGCVFGCRFPDDCSLCNTTAGYREDCTGCIQGYSPRGFLICEQDPQIIFSPTTYLEKHPFIYEVQNATYTITPDDIEPTYSPCTSYLDTSAKSFPGAWIKFTSKENGYISISTDHDYSWTELNFLSKQCVWIGTDTALILQDENGICIHKNDDMVDYVSSSRLTFYAEANKNYYILAHGYYGSYLESFDLIVKTIIHPCVAFPFVVEWNDIVNTGGFSLTTKAATGSLSKNPCIAETRVGNWFSLDGADHSILITGTAMVLHVISVPIDEYSCISANAKCEAVVSTTKSGNIIILQLTPERKYFFFFSFHDDHLFIDFNIKIVCSHCEGFCSLTHGGCLCNGTECATCGNGVLDSNEECDNSFKQSVGCNSDTCSCDLGFISKNGICVPTHCGNNQIDDGEECDGGEGCENCLCSNNYVAYSSPRLSCLSLMCGNEKIDNNEECDGGDGCVECECQDGWFKRGESVHCKKLSNSMYIGVAISSFVFVDVLLYVLILLISWLSEKKLNSVIALEREAVDRLLPFFETNIIPFDPTDAEKIDISKQNMLFEISDRTFKLDEHDDNYIEVGKMVESSFTITNKAPKTLHYTCHAIENYKYSIRFQPVTQSVRPGHTVRVNVLVSAKCTTKVDDEIYITFRYGKLHAVLMDINQQEASYDSKDSSSRDDRSKSASRKRRDTVTREREGIKGSNPKGSKTSSERRKANKTKMSKYYCSLQLKFESSLSTKLDLDELNLIHPAIGEGTYGIVYKAEWRKVDVAVKIMKTDIVDYSQLLPHFVQEANIMESIRSQFIINFIGSVITPDKLCLVTEFCEYGSLRSFMKNNENIMSLAFKLRCMYDIAHGMFYLHQNDIIHRDLKPDNVLVYSTNVSDPVCAKVTDFGTSGVFAISSDKLNIKDIGTPMYMAPEIHQSNQITFKSDVFSFAVCMLEIFLKKNPYPHDLFPDTESILKFVCADKRLEISDECPVKKLIMMCWNQNPQDRPDFREISMELKVITGMDSSDTASISEIQKPKRSSASPYLPKLGKSTSKRLSGEREKEKLKRSVIPSRKRSPSPTGGVIQMPITPSMSLDAKRFSIVHSSVLSNANSPKQSKELSISQSVEKLFTPTHSVSPKMGRNLSSLQQSNNNAGEVLVSPRQKTKSPVNGDEKIIRTTSLQASSVGLEEKKVVDNAEPNPDSKKPQSHQNSTLSDNQNLTESSESSEDSEEGLQDNE